MLHCVYLAKFEPAVRLDTVRAGFFFRHMFSVMVELFFSSHLSPKTSCYGNKFFNQCLLKECVDIPYDVSTSLIKVVIC